jgi:hypothetical protein
MTASRWPHPILGVLLVLLGAGGRSRAQEVVPGFEEVPEPSRAAAPPAAAPVRVAEPAPGVELPLGEACPPPILMAKPGFPFVPYMLGDMIGPLVNPMTGIKIAEGDSPIPIDRVFYRFNAYENLDPDRYRSPFERYAKVNLYTNVFGFEKTFFDGAMSFGMRLPINVIEATSRGSYQVRLPNGTVVTRPAGPDYSSSLFGNINTIFKARLFSDPAKGSLVSAGAAFSFPTATTQQVDPGPSTAAVFQPFLGFVFARERFFAQGFTSLTLPVVTAQSMLWFGDLGVGYWVYRRQAPGGFLTGIAPTFEMHLNVPLQSSERIGEFYEAVDLLPFDTQFNLTFGGTIEFARKATLGLGVVLPTASPLPFEYEFLAHLNFRF